MKLNRIICGLFSFVFALTPTAAQTTPADGKEVVIELRSPWIRKDAKRVGYDRTIAGRNCVSLTTLQQICHSSNSLSYGDRMGDNWDIFSISSRQDQTRMIDLGAHSWDDKLEVPIVEPWPPLPPGATRNIIVSLRGADGAHGRNGDGSMSSHPKPRKGNGNAPIPEQASSTVTIKNVVRADKYLPYLMAKKGHMYLVRVIEGEWDYHLLVRVDELVRGEKVKLSMRRLAVNPEGPK
jgi:hypothetical protein